MAIVTSWGCQIGEHSRAVVLKFFTVVTHFVSHGDLIAPQNALWLPVVRPQGLLGHGVANDVGCVAHTTWKLQDILAVQGGIECLAAVGSHWPCIPPKIGHDPLVVHDPQSENHCSKVFFLSNRFDIPLA